MDLANRATLRGKIPFLLHCFAKASAAYISGTHQPLANSWGFLLNVVLEMPNTPL